MRGKERMRGGVQKRPGGTREDRIREVEIISTFDIGESKREQSEQKKAEQRRDEKTRGEEMKYERRILV